MVQCQTPRLDQTFHALADGTRRQILASLADRQVLSVSEIAKPFEISLPAVLKHIAVLEAAGLVAREKRGRTVYCRLDARPLAAAEAWLTAYEQFWSGTLDRLTTYLEDETCPKPPPPQPTSSDPTPRASRSAARSRPRRPASSKRSRRAKT